MYLGQEKEEECEGGTTEGGREGGKEDGGSVQEVERERVRKEGRGRDRRKGGGVGLLQPTETGRV